MNTDIRIAVGFWHHPKTKRLVREAGLEAVRSLQIFWSWVAQYRPDGNISDLDYDDIEDAADWCGPRGEFVLAIKERWLEERGDEWWVHDWADHNPWAAEADDRSDEARLLKLSQINREAFDRLKAEGRKGISKDEFRLLKAKKSCAQERAAVRDASATQERAAVRDALAPAPAPAPAPLPAPTPKEKNPSSEKSAARFPDGGVELSLACLLRDLINERSPNGKPLVPQSTNMQTWAKQIDLMIRCDAREPPEIERVIRWCQQDQFWRSNIMSTGKLREKYATLLDKMSAEDEGESYLQRRLKELEEEEAKQ